jgi:hypothetical protein
MGRKGGRSLNPTDAFRKQQRKKELKKVRFLEIALGAVRNLQFDCS